MVSGNPRENCYVCNPVKGRKIVVNWRGICKRDGESFTYVRFPFGSFLNGGYSLKCAHAIGECFFFFF